ncbi:hypothetical protein NDU88_005673 [Pleurodeles waltl]|uniref:Uncharacterized protein n=1 Tax=Pleurodeles waltl TaxID=8319 RepID=A0AAV7WZE4_PLEWA|nr:hypothetical protein NDU88_005673 [Pleurodeles waltl]
MAETLLPYRPAEWRDVLLLSFFGGETSGDFWCCFVLARVARAPPSCFRRGARESVLSAHGSARSALLPCFIATVSVLRIQQPAPHPVALLHGNREHALSARKKLVVGMATQITHEEDNVVLPRLRDSRLTSRARDRELETLGVERTVEAVAVTSQQSIFQ